MVYILEISYSAIKASSDIPSIIKKLANYYMCDSYHLDYEIEGEKRIIIRNHYVITIEFTDYPKYFINNIKALKGVYLETIYNTNTNKLLHSSSYFKKYKQTK